MIICWIELAEKRDNEEIFILQRSACDPRILFLSLLW